MERRKSSISKPSALPLDYLRMVSDIFKDYFDEGLKLYSAHKPNPRFEVQGEVFADEVILAVSLMNEGQLAATTVYASSDFDPKASSPAVQEILSACVDAAATVFATLLSPDTPEIIQQVSEDTLSALSNVPFEWTEIESNKKRIYIKLDKSNLVLESITDDWLRKNDPEYRELEKQEQEETEKLFITGKKSKPPSTIH